MQAGLSVIDVGIEFGVSVVNATHENALEEKVSVVSCYSEAKVSSGAGSGGWKDKDAGSRARKKNDVMILRGVTR